MVLVVPRKVDLPQWRESGMLYVLSTSSETSEKKYMVGFEAGIR